MYVYIYIYIYIYIMCVYIYIHIHTYMYRLRGTHQQYPNMKTFFAFSLKAMTPEVLPWVGGWSGGGVW